MFGRIASATLVTVVAASALPAGYYSGIEEREEMRPAATDYENIFKKRLDHLRAIPAQKVEYDPPLRQRYVMLEALAREAPGRGGMPKLDTLEQQLIFSSVLIRRGRARDAALALEAVVLPEHENHFMVLSHYASALFLSGERPLEKRSVRYMKKALEKWPKIKLDDSGVEFADLTDEQKKLLKSFGWDLYDIKNYREYETYFERLILSRVKEKDLLLEKKPTPESVDPIFVDSKGQPIRFVNDKGEFEAGAIAKSAKEQMPHMKAVDVVEQLLIWMPNDTRLFWLLGEVFNASAMERPTQKAKNQAVANAYSVFDSLYKLMADPLGPQIPKYGFEEIKLRREALATYLRQHQESFDLPLPDETKPESPWWRIGVGFAAGMALGMFALWQIQEIRRRRATRAGMKA